MGESKQRATRLLPVGCVMAAVVLLAGCGGSSSSGSGTSSARPSTARATSKAAGIRTIEDLRAAVRKAGVSCPDSAWKPNLAPDVKHASGEGVCAGTLTLVVFKDTSEVGQAQIRADLAEADLKKGIGDDAPEKEVLAGPGWGAMGDKPTIAMIRAALGGSGIG